MFFHKFRESRQYWFKPKKYWGYFAAYYPVTWQAWIITFAAASSVYYLAKNALQNSFSPMDAIVSGAPGIIIILFLFDLITFRTGEYPNWWKKRR